MSPFIDFAFLDSGTGGIPYMLELKKNALMHAVCIWGIRHIFRTDRNLKKKLQTVRLRRCRSS